MGAEAEVFGGGTAARDAALMEWALRPPAPEFGRPAGPFLFGMPDGRANSAAPVPVEDRAERVFVDGTARRRYAFALRMALDTSAREDPTNARNMALMRAWQEWTAAKARAGDYPDFGPRCGGYRLAGGGSAPRLAATMNNETAVYEFHAAIEYTEEGERHG